jgi:hypothetical protein
MDSKIIHFNIFNIHYAVRKRVIRIPCVTHLNRRVIRIILFYGQETSILNRRIGIRRTRAQFKSQPLFFPRFFRVSL